MNIAKIAKEILDEEQVEVENKQEQLESSIPQKEIDSALDIANFLRDKANSILADVELAIQDLSGKSKPSILESKDDFKSLFLKLKQMKKKIGVV